MHLKKCARKKLAAFLSCSAAISSLTALPMQTAAADDAAYIFRDSFESGDCGWSGRGGCTVRSNGDMPYADSAALFVSGRSDTWQGPEKALSAVCETGKAYSFSVCVEYETGPASVTFQLSLAYKDAGG